MKHALLIAALLTSGMAQAFDINDLAQDGLPPIVDETPIVVDVAAEPGACWVHPVAAPVDCHRVHMPDGTVQDHFIDGFVGNGPARLHVNQLTYDWSQNRLSHPVLPGLALIERLD